jgi:putative transposase
VRKSRFNEEQIIAILKESEAGKETGELCRRHGITRASFYRWKSKFGGLELSEAKRLRQLEEENRQLKHIVAEQAVDIRRWKRRPTKRDVSNWPTSSWSLRAMRRLSSS